MKSCFFVGHREADERLLPVLQSTIQQLIEEEGVTEFYFGGYGGFDRIAGAAVKQLKAEYPQISLKMVIPYHPAERPVEAPNGYDGTYYPDGLEGVSQAVQNCQGKQDYDRYFRLANSLCLPRSQQFPEIPRICRTQKKEGVTSSAEHCRN